MRFSTAIYFFLLYAVADAKMKLSISSNTTDWFGKLGMTLQSLARLPVRDISSHYYIFWIER